MRKTLISAVLLAATLGGCDRVDMVPLNQQAQAVGSPRLVFARGLPGGPLKVTMPDGEGLTGFYRIDEVPVASTASDPGGGNFHATLRGPRTTLVCTASLVAGHGPGECRGQDGAAYRLQL